jgi:CHAT domain-containing protein
MPRKDSLACPTNKLCSRKGKFNLMPKKTVLLFLFQALVHTAVAQELSPDTLLYMRHYEKGMASMAQGDYPTTKAYVKKLRALAYKNGWEDLWVDHVLDLSGFELYEGNFNGSKQLFDSLIGMIHNGEIKKDMNKFLVYNRFSGFLIQDGDIEASQQLMVEAAQLVPRLPKEKQNSARQKIENVRALNYSTFGNLRRAKSSFLYAVDLLHKAYQDGTYPNREEYGFAKVILYKNVANNDIKAGEFEMAKVYLDSALAAFAALTDPYYTDSPMKAALNETLGEYYMGLENPQLAEQFMKDRIAELEKYDTRVNLQMRIEARQKLASLYVKSGDIEAARMHYDSSLEYLKSFQTSDASRYRYLWPIIHFHQLMGDHRTADGLLAQVDFETDPIRLYYAGAQGSIVSLYALKSRSLAQQMENGSDLEAKMALDYNRRSIELSNQIGLLNKAGLNNSLKRPTQLALDIYMENLRSLHLSSPDDLGPILEALNVIDFAKNQEFNNQRIARYLSSSGKINPLYEREKTIKRKLAQKEKDFGSKKAPSDLDSLVLLSAELESVRNEMLKERTKQSTLPLFNFDQLIVQGNGLQTDQQELHYFYVDDRLHVLSRSGSVSGWKWRTATVPGLASTLAKVNGQVKQVSDTSWKALLQELHGILIADVLEEKTGRLILYPYGNIGLVPFAALIDKKQDYLIKDYAIVVKNTLETSPQKSNGFYSSNEVLAFAPYFDGAQQQAQRQLYGYLEGTKNEVAGISRYFDTRLFDGLAATKENFMKESKNNRLIHIATHAFAEPNVMFSKIIFSGGPQDEEHSLYGYEIEDMVLEADMLILSACQTGYGTFELGSGLASLARLFENAGTKSLLYTLWNVDDFASADLMTLYYQYLEDGLEKDLALQAAQIQYLKNNKDLKDMPYYWSGFVISGEESPIHDNTFMIWFFVGIGAILAILAIRRYIGRKTQA